MNVLKVYYPYGGEHYLLRWYSDYTGAHIIFARSKSSAEHIFSKVFDQCRYVVVKEFVCVNIVSPGPAECERYAKDCFEKEVNMFWCILGSTARNYKRKTGTLPPKLQACDQYKSEDGSMSTYEQHDYDKTHYGCVNCHDEGVIPVRGTFTSVYLMHREEYLKKNPLPTNKKLVTSNAPLPDVTKPLYIISESHSGHNSIGFVLKKYHRLDAPLCFYQDPQEVDKTIVNDWIALKTQKYNQWKQDHDEQEKKRQLEYDASEFLELLHYFGE